MHLIIKMMHVVAMVPMLSAILSMSKKWLSNSIFLILYIHRFAWSHFPIRFQLWLNNFVKHKNNLQRLTCNYIVIPYKDLNEIIYFLWQNKVSFKELSIQDWVIVLCSRLFACMTKHLQKDTKKYEHMLPVLFLYLL